MDKTQIRRMRIADKSWEAFSTLAEDLGLSQGVALEELMLHGRAFARLGRSFRELRLRDPGGALNTWFLIVALTECIEELKKRAEQVNAMLERTEDLGELDPAAFSAINELRRSLERNAVTAGIMMQPPKAQESEG